VRINSASSILFVCFQLIGFVGSTAGSTGVVINELMVSPATGGEWIELYNTQSQPFDISNWRIIDAAGHFGVINSGITIPANGYCVLLQDSATALNLNAPFETVTIVPSGWTSLNNDGDQIRLLDSSGALCDEVLYDNRAASVSGRSWEKIDPNSSGTDLSNWGPCSDPSGSTPGRHNSLSLPLSNSKCSVWADPNPFSPDNDGRDDITFIHFSFSSAVLRLSIDIYTANGESVRTLASNIPAGTDSPVLAWDGKDDSSRLLPIGRYIILARAVDQHSDKTFIAKSTVVLARKL
jgi:hypothetical protein